MAESGFVQTVLGPVPPEDVGITLIHEHVIVDMTTGASSAGQIIEQTESGKAAARVVEAGFDPGQAGLAPGASFLGKWGEPLTLENWRDVDNHWFYYGGFKITDVGDVAYEADLFKQYGGSCLVDQTSIGLGRDPIALQRVSRSSGVHVVMGTGYYINDYHPPDIATMSEDEVKDRIVYDCEVGVAGGVKAGLIGEVGSRWPMHADEEKVLRACARASAETGVALSIHVGRAHASNEPVYNALRIAEEAGADPARTIMSHVEGRLPTSEGPDSFDIAPFLELAKTGVYLAFDTFGWEPGNRQRSAIDVPHDPVRLNYIKALAEAGHGRQVLIGEDLVLQHWQRKHGGHGWVHVPETVIPLMRHKRFDDELIDLVLVQNPRRVLTVV